MLIANPLYDVVFKRLMENERVVKFFIGTLLRQTIESVTIQQQEFTHTPEEIPGITILRMDFVATIKTETGELKKILIEIQKARDESDVMRFRNYLATQYKKRDTVGNKQTALPIITIYILGFNLKNIKTACLHVGNVYEDMMDEVILSVKEDLIEKVTHECYVVQVQRIADRCKTQLDKMLSVFEQNNFTDERSILKDYKHETDLEELKIMTGILSHAGSDSAERERIEKEQESWRTFIDAVEVRKQKDHEALEKELGETRKVVVENKKALEEKDKVIEEKDKALEENKKVIEEKDKVNEKLLRELEELKRNRGKK